MADAICPWCGEEVDDSPNLLDMDDRDGIIVECAVCGEDVLVRRLLTIVYLCSKVED